MTVCASNVRVHGDAELRDHLRQITGGGAGLSAVLGVLENIAEELAHQEYRARRRKDRAQLYLSLARTVHRAAMTSCLLEVGGLPHARPDQQGANV